MLSVKQRGIKYHFKVFGVTGPGIEPRSPGPLAKTLLTRPMSRLDFYSMTLFLTFLLFFSEDYVTSVQKYSGIKKYSC